VEVLLTLLLLFGTVLSFLLLLLLWSLSLLLEA
jgi:hypothetical protein